MSSLLATNGNQSMNAVLDKRIKDLMAKGSEGANIIARSLIQPLREYQDYVGVGRTAFLVQELQQGQPPILDQDVDPNVAYQVSDLGENVLKLINPLSVRVNLMTIAANPAVTYSEIKSRTYPLKERIIQRTKAEVFRVEDRAIFNCLSATAFHEYTRVIFQKNYQLENPITFGGGQKITIPGTPINPPVVANRDTLSIQHFSIAMSLIERHGGLKATNLYMNPYNALILRNMNINNTNGFYIDFETSKELMEKGFIANCYGMRVIVSPVIPTDKIIITAEPEYTGRIIVNLPLTVLPNNDVSNRRIEFSIFEEIGVLCYNPRAVCGIQIMDTQTTTGTPQSATQSQPQTTTH